MWVIRAVAITLVLGGCAADQSSLEVASATPPHSAPSTGAQASNAERVTSAAQSADRNPISSFFWALDAAVQGLKDRASQPSVPAVASLPSAPAPVTRAEPRARTVAAVPAPKSSEETRAADAPTRRRERTIVARPPSEPRRADTPPANAEASSPRSTPGDVTSSTRLANPALAYEEAMLRRDAGAMARAARQITGQPVSAASIKALNEQLGIEADDELVEAIARASQ